MRLVVLGSCGGRAAAGRACSGYLLELDGRRLWLDAGSGTLARLLEETTLGELDCIFVSHLHADHWTDLPIAVHTLKQLRGRAEPLPVLGPPRFLEHVGLPPGPLGELVRTTDLADGLEDDVGVRVRAASVRHGAIDCFGLRVDGARESFFYTADTGPFDGLAELACGVDTLLCECGGVPDEQPTHLTPEQAGALAHAADVGRLVLTHLMPEADPDEVRERAAAVWDGPLAVATDGLVL